MIGQLRAWLSSLFRRHRQYAVDTTSVKDDINRLASLMAEWEAITGETLRKDK